MDIRVITHSLSFAVFRLKQKSLRMNRVDSDERSQDTEDILPYDYETHNNPQQRNLAYDKFDNVSTGNHSVDENTVSDSFSLLLYLLRL